MPTCLIVQHVAPERPFAIAAALAGAGVGIDLRQVFSEEGLPPGIAGLDGLVVMGGPMSARHDEGFPTRRAEIALLAEAAAAGLPTLGICLGAQLLAVATGGEVVAGAAGLEVGWSPVRWTEEAGRDPLFAGVAPETTVLHWHGDTYRRAPGVHRLASSVRYPEQAFRAGGAAWGLQFHLEVDAEAVRGFAGAFPDDAGAAGGAAALMAQAPAAIGALRPVCDTVFGRFAALVAAGSGQASVAPRPSGPPGSANERAKAPAKPT